jgi:four helix bundle protein
MILPFEKLHVCQKTVDFADALCTAMKPFRCSYGFLVDQLNRVAISISPNIAEGKCRFTKADRKKLQGIEH